MKKLIGVALLVAIMSITNANDDFQADLVGIKIYKGDDGKNISCSSKGVLVQEIYKVSNTDLKNIVMAHWSSNGGLSLYHRKWKIRGTNNLEFGYCTTKGFKADFQTKFMNFDGKTSNTVNFSIDVDSLPLLEAKEFPSLVNI